MRTAKWFQVVRKQQFAIRRDGWQSRIIPLRSPDAQHLHAICLSISLCNRYQVWLAGRDQIYATSTRQGTSRWRSSVNIRRLAESTRRLASLLINSVCMQPAIGQQVHLFAFWSHDVGPSRGPRIAATLQARNRRAGLSDSSCTYIKRVYDHLECTNYRKI